MLDLYIANPKIPMGKRYKITLTKDALLIASLVPFERYVKIRFTGKIWIVEYDGKTIYLRSSLLPKPKEAFRIRISRVGLWKRGFSKSILRAIAEEFIDSLPEERRAYEFLLRLSKLWRRGLRYKIDKRRSEIAKAIGIITPKYIAKLMQAYNAEGYEIERKTDPGGLKGFFIRAGKKLKGVKRLFKKPKAKKELPKANIYLY